MASDARSSEMDSHEELYSALTFNLYDINVSVAECYYDIVFLSLNQAAVNRQ